MHTYKKMTAESKSGIRISIKGLKITKTDPRMTSLSPKLGKKGQNSDILNYTTLCYTQLYTMVSWFLSVDILGNPDVPRNVLDVPRNVLRPPTETRSNVRIPDVPTGL